MDVWLGMTRRRAAESSPKVDDAGMIDGECFRRGPGECVAKRGDGWRVERGVEGGEERGGEREGEREREERRKRDGMDLDDDVDDWLTIDPLERHACLSSFSRRAGEGAGLGAAMQRMVWVDWMSRGRGGRSSSR